MTMPRTPHDASEYAFSKYLDEAARDAELRVTKLESSDIKKIRAELEARFSTNPGGTFSNFSPLGDCARFQYDMADDWFPEFVGAEDCILFYDSSIPNDEVGYVIHGGRDLVILLRNFAFPSCYYLTNPSLDYVLFFTDADVAVAVGTAAPWLAERGRRHLSSEQDHDT